jgi:transglutaminase-like putative cysteine protease
VKGVRFSPFVLGSALAVIVPVQATAQTAGSAFESPVTAVEVRIVYSVNADGTYTREESDKIRVNTAQALQGQSQTYIPYSESLQRVEVLEAYTQTADGQRVDVAPEQIITQQNPLSTNAPAFADVKVKAIVFPRMSPGATKAYRFRLTQTRPLFANEFSMIEQFPSILDIDSASVTLIAPADLPIHVQAVGIEGGPVKADEPGRAKWVWTLANAKAVPPEPGMVNPLDFSPRVVATTFADFGAAAKAYLDGAADKAGVTLAVQKRANEITAGITNPRKQAEALYNWVASNIRYVALNFGLGGVVPRTADAILETGYGDCKDNVALLGALLAAKGIKSSPVLVNAANVFWQPDVAIVPGVYNHAIAYLPDFDLFVDPTAQVAPFGVLPGPEVGKTALVTAGLDKGAGLETLPLAPATAEAVTKIEIAEDGSARGETTIKATGPLEFAARASMARIPPGQQDQVATRVLASTGQMGQGSLNGGDPRNLAEPFTIEATFSLQNVMNVPGPGAMSIPLGVPSPVTLTALARDVAMPERRQPIACAPYDKTETTTVAFPDGTEPKQVPAAVKVENRLGSFEAEYSRDGRSVTVKRRLVLRPPRPLCGPEEYQDIRALGEAVGRDLRAQILY